MKIILIPVALFVCSFANAQKSNTNTSGTEKNNVRVGVSFSPDITNRSYPNNRLGRIQREFETSKFGYTTGVNFIFNKSKSLEFETGLLYSRKGYQTKNNTLIPEQPDPAMPVKAKFIYNYNYIDIPLKVNVVFGESNVRFITGAGVVTNILLGEKVTSIFEYSNGNTVKKTEPSTFNNKKINLSPMISAGVDYKLKEKTSLRLEPTFRYGLLQPNIWSAGLNVDYYCTLH